MRFSNIDKQTAVWQTLNPDTNNAKAWFQPSAPNAQVPDPKPTAGLPPFHKDSQGNLYTSNDLKKWTNLHYDYDVLARKPNETDADYLQRMTNYVNTYASTAPAVISAPTNLLAPSEQALQNFREEAVESAEVAAADANVDPGSTSVEAVEAVTATASVETSAAAPAPEPSSDAESSIDDIYPDYILNVIYDR